MPTLMQPELQVTNEPGGLALVNGTPTIATYTTPNDGHFHTVFVNASLVVTTTEVGGAINVVVGGTTIALFAAAQTGPATYVNGVVLLVPPNTAVNVNQTALTAGASSLVCDIWSTP